MTQIALVIESVEEKLFWGRVEYDDDLIVDSAATIELLEKKFRKLLKDFHDLDPKQITFDLQYDISGLFEENKYLNASAIAEMAGINKSLMRQYTSGVKHPSYERAMHIQKVINQIGKQLAVVKIASSGKSMQKAGTGKDAGKGASTPRKVASSSSRDKVMH